MSTYSKYDELGWASEAEIEAATEAERLEVTCARVAMLTDSIEERTADLERAVAEWKAGQKSKAESPAPVEMEREERRINGNVYVTLTGEAAQVDAASVAFISRWPWAYSPRIEGRVALKDGRVRITLFRFASC